jgi:arabinan endo-1,5-alpha-L-arabinosidase
MKRGDINIRDPFVLTADGRYYLYGTRGETCWGAADGFDVYTGTDLENWEGPTVCFHNDGSFWATENYWAPEVHPWRGRYVMLAGFKAPGVRRCTCSLVADGPEGPFRPLSYGGLTPKDWECLDGTLVVSQKGAPYLVFCHEWVQAVNGEVCALPLSADLSAPAGEPRVLFRAADAPWVQSIRNERTGVTGFVTDGPFGYRTREGQLLLLWSSFSSEGYAQAIARGDGDIDAGTFTVDPTPLFAKDGGHGMVFTTPDGRRMLALHAPNVHLKERPVFMELREEDGTLVKA